jgi:hypothetical protein
MGHFSSIKNSTWSHFSVRIEYKTQPMSPIAPAY